MTEHFFSNRANARDFDVSRGLERPWHHPKAFAHFSQRVQQRLQGLNEVVLWYTLQEQVRRAERGLPAAVRFGGRLGDRSRRIWWFTHPETDEEIAAIFDHAAEIPITVITETRARQVHSRHAKGKCWILEAR